MRESLTLALLLLWSGAAPALASPQNDEAFAKALARGEVLMAEERYEEAIRALKRAKKLAGERRHSCC